MFNQLTAAEVVSAVGRAARGAARDGESGGDYARGQLLSAYSSSRHVAVEIEFFEPELRAFAARLAEAATALPDGGQLAARLESAHGAGEASEATCMLLDRLRGDDSPLARDLHRSVRAALRRLADREVELLAEAIEGPA